MFQSVAEPAIARSREHERFLIEQRLSDACVGDRDPEGAGEMVVAGAGACQCGSEGDRTQSAHRRGRLITQCGNGFEGFGDMGAREVNVPAPTHATLVEGPAVDEEIRVSGGRRHRDACDLRQVAHRLPGSLVHERDQHAST